MVLICWLILLLMLYLHFESRKIRQFSLHPRSHKRTGGFSQGGFSQGGFPQGGFPQGGFPQGGFPQAKPLWVKSAILEMHENLHLSHRKLADLFNNLYLAETGMSVGRTWVRETIMQHERKKLHQNKALKHRVPRKLARNVIWGMDTTVVADQNALLHTVMGLIDHGTRMNLCLRRLRRFNTWTCLGCIFLAIREFGKPKTIKLDNHPVFRSRLLKTVLGAAGIRLWFSEPGKPWQNGRIERFFGTLKTSMQGHVFEDQAHVLQAMAEFQCWYNLARVHQHLRGRRPVQAWLGIDPHLTPPKTVQWISAWGGRFQVSVARRAGIALRCPKIEQIKEAKAIFCAVIHG